MVRAILEGRKTQTRRVVKPPFEFVGKTLMRPDGTGGLVCTYRSPYLCPYGIPGDRLWVRETWAAPHAYDGMPPRMIPGEVNWHYAATEERGGLLWRTSIHMPRVACRITLEVVSDRVERLHDISEADAIAEGVEVVDSYKGEPLYRHYLDDGLSERYATGAYATLWQRLYGSNAWKSNPYVWAVEFKRVAVQQ